MVNKQELINRMAKRLQVTKKTTEEFLDVFVGEVADALKDDEKVRIHGFLSMEAIAVDETVMKSPKTGEVVNVPAHRKIRVRVGEGLRNFVNMQK